MAQEELTFKAPGPAGTCAEAAVAAADAYAGDNEKQAQAVMDAWESVLRVQTKRYVKDAMTEASITAQG